MPNKHMLKNIFSFVILSTSLIACQTVPKTAQQTTTPVEAETEAKTTIQLDPPIQDESQQTLYQQAIQSTQAGDIDTAIIQFKQLINKNPSTKRAYTNLGLLYLHKKQNNAAIESFQNAIQLDKKDAIAYNHLAIIQRQQGEFTKALYNYYNAINADASYANAHLNLGILLDIYLQDLPKALEQYEIYQTLVDTKNQPVDKWIIDIKRRIDANKDK